MALASTIVWEIRQGGSDTNGGGFNSAASGTDWTLQNGPQYSVVDGVTNGTTTITSATAAFGADVAGNVVYVQGGTGSVAANWYEIISRTNSTTIVVDRSTGLTAGTGVTLKIGGALGTPGVLSSVAGGIGGQLVSGQKCSVKYSVTPMSCSTATAGPAGPCQIPSGVAFSVEGYDVTRGDRTGNRPSYQWTVAPGGLTYAYKLIGTARQVFLNLQADGNSKTNAGGFDVSAVRVSAIECVAIHCNQSAAVGFLVTNYSAVRCFASDCTNGFSGAGSGGIVSKCTATGGTVGFNGIAFCVKCLAYSVPTGFTATNTIFTCINCTADTCTTTGFSNTSGMGCFESCMATNCTGTGTGFTLGANLATLHNCAAYNNNSNVSGTPVVNEGPFASGNTLTSLGADPYANQPGADFRANNNSPGGAQIRAAGLGVYGQTDSQDIGADQHTDPVGGGGTLIQYSEY
jgi:hypothetical protein